MVAFIYSDGRYNQMLPSALVPVPENPFSAFYTRSNKKIEFGNEISTKHNVYDYENEEDDLD